MPSRSISSIISLAILGVACLLLCSIHTVDASPIALDAVNNHDKRAPALSVSTTTALSRGRGLLLTSSTTIKPTVTLAKGRGGAASTSIKTSTTAITKKTSSTTTQKPTMTSRKPTTANSSTKPKTTTSTTAKASSSSTKSTSAVASSTATGSVPNNGAFAANILAAHNAARKSHGAKALTWSSTAESYAKTWAEKCVWTHGGAPNQGQNLAASAGFEQTGQEIIDRWMSEEKDYNPNSPSALHFTQVVWKSTTAVGCYQATCNKLFNANGSETFPGYSPAYFTVCNYTPAGNFQGQYPQNVQKNN